MAKSRDSKQFSFRVNFNNPDHLKVYRTLMDLNLDIHKSVSSFVIKALVQYRSEERRVGKECRSRWSPYH